MRKRRFRRWCAITNASFGPLGKHLGQFRTRLSSLGYTQGTIETKLLIARHLNKWLHQRRLHAKKLNEKTLKKFLIDRKVPREERNRTLLLARGNEVLWVVGLAISDHVKVTPRTRHLLHLRSKSCPNETK